MIAIIAVLIMLCLSAVISLLRSFGDVANWLNEADFEPHDEKIKPYMDNSEYDWGHNIINYMKEDQ